MFRLIRIFTFAVLSLLAFAVPVAAQSQIGVRQLKPEEATSVLEAFRGYRPPADSCMVFEIIHKPRKSDEETVYSGTMWGKYLDDGLALRLRIGKKGAASSEQKSFLIHSGKNPSLWELGADGEVKKVDAESTRPFFADLVFTPFDLQTPFLFWEKSEYDRTRRHRARPVHFFKMFPPESFTQTNPEIGFVKIGFDRVYNALVTAEVCNPDGKKLKSFMLGKVQKVQEIYSFKELELRDEVTRDRDTLIVRAAALRLGLPRQFFRPEALAQPDLRLPASVFQNLD